MYKFEEKKLLSMINEDILNIIKEEKCIIAGGCITSLFTRRDINDIDIYFRNKESLIRALKYIKDDYYINSHTDKATMFTEKEQAYQFIHFKFFNDAKEIFDTFDFTVCMAAYDFKTNEFILHDEFLKHNAQKMLKFNHNTAYPIMSALRVQKYEKKGYVISKPEFIKIMLTINNLKINTYKEVKEQIGGMYGVNYDNLFVDLNDTDKIDINKIIEKLSDSILDDDYFKLPINKTESCCFDDDIDKFINSFYLENGCKIYKKDLRAGWGKASNYIVVKDNSIIDIIDEEDLEIDESRISSDNCMLYVYKNVNKIEDKLFSYYDEEFEYKIGVETKANNECGLFFDESENSASTYKNNSNSVLIKAMVFIDDIIKDLTFKKCIPLEIVRIN